MKKILILKPKNIKAGQPSYERIHAFENFYKINNIEILTMELPSNIKEKIYLIKYILKNNIKNIFISMPPFRNWFLFLLPGRNIILDIRDGWSIAMKSGYGGTCNPSFIKSFIAKIIEIFAMYRSAIAITCTNGLQKYLTEITNKNILLITNGYNQKSLQIVNKLKSTYFKRDLDDIAICVGKFSEYGTEKVKIIINKISEKNKNTTIKLVGSDIKSNSWIQEWIIKQHITNIKIELLPRMNKTDMYKEILQATYGLAVIRDPSYDFGTKVFDYILCEIPIFDYFDSDNNFKIFFINQLNSAKIYDFNTSFLREELLNKEKSHLIKV